MQKFAAFLLSTIVAGAAFAQTPAPAAKPVSATPAATAVKADAKVDAKSKAMNANAAVTPDEHKTVRTHRHHHKHLSAKKSLTTQPDATKPATMDKRS